MQYSIKQFLLLGVIAFVLVGTMTPLMRILALRVGAVDAPNSGRKIQKEPIPYLGGVAIVIGVLATSYGALLYTNFSMTIFLLASSVLLPALGIGVMGLIDDLRGLQPWPRLIAQTFVALIVSVILISSNTIGSAFGNHFLDSAISILWIVGVCNSINFFDNLDGGASGAIAIITCFLFFIAFDRQQVIVSALSIVTTGATLGFLLWNRPPAKIYMGDAGTLFLGIMVAVLTIRLNPGVASQTLSVAIPGTLMAVPILDTTVAVGSRIFRGISPFQGGRDHLSHRLMRIGFGRRITAFALWGLTFFYASLALAIYVWPDSLGQMLFCSASLSWLGLLIFFFRIPSTDE